MTRIPAYLLFLSFLYVAYGVTDHVQKPALLHFPITVSRGAPIVKNITKRQNDIAISSQQTGYFYTIDLVLGTPGQLVSVNFDTGSSELWVNPLCHMSNDPDFCDTFGQFNESSTFQGLDLQGRITYGTGSVDFDYGYDYISLGSARVSQQIFGVAFDSDFTSVGIMGAGPSLLGWNSPYPYLVDSLAQQGYTNSRAFSLDIRALTSDRGSVVFGGIDTMKYSGLLEKRPIIPATDSPDGYTRYWIYLDGISVVQGNGTEILILSNTNGQPVLIDSGYTLSALPGPLFEAIVDAFPSAEAISGTSLYSVDCPVEESLDAINFRFGETVIRVPYADFVWRQPDQDLCVLGVYRDDDFPVLGDTFLRAAYVVFDWDNRNIHLANNEDCGSNLVAIGSGLDAVPSIAGKCGLFLPVSSRNVPTATAISTSSSENLNEPTRTLSDEVSISTSATFGESVVSGSLAVETTTLWLVDPADSIISTSYGLPQSKTPTVVSALTSNSFDERPLTTFQCPAAFTTTMFVTTYQTQYPNTTHVPRARIISTITMTRTYTVAQCSSGAACALGEVKTEVVTQATSHAQETTATYTIPHLSRCNLDQFNCSDGKVKTLIDIVTVLPMTTRTGICSPGYTSCAVTSSSVETSTPIFSVVTGATAKTFEASGLAILALALIIIFAM